MGAYGELSGTVGRVAMPWDVWDSDHAGFDSDRPTKRGADVGFGINDFLSLAGLEDESVEVYFTSENGMGLGVDRVVGLYGYDDVVQEGGVLVFNLDDINVAALLDEYDDLDQAEVKLASLDDWADDEDWLRMVESCRGKCTGTVGFLDMLLQAKPGGAKGIGADTI